MENLRDELLKAKESFYRLFIMINSEKWRDFLSYFLSEFLTVNDKISVGYAFHPWIEGAKDRFSEITEMVKNSEIVDIDYSSYEKYLGSTFDLMILDAIDDFRPNYISALSDSVRGGGIVILYSDDITKNKLFKNSLTRNGIVDNFFEERFLRLAKSHEGIVLVNGEETFFKPFTQQVQIPSNQIPEDYKIDRELHELCKSKDQNKALEEMDFIIEEGKRVLAITAPRGRGKSSVVGLFLSYLVVHKKVDSVIVTSPSYLSAQEIFKFLVKGLGVLKVKYKLFKSKDGKILAVSAKGVVVKWLAPDLAKDHEGDLIVIDEAAALGLELLDYILSRWNKVILVTTIHGYEGSGKAFMKYLNAIRQRYKFKHITLDFPIRYAKGDPVERFLYDVMLLDAEPKSKRVGEVKEVDRASLFKNEGMLRQIYGILVSAHYRNSPDDLMILGDLHYQRLFTIGEIGVTQVVEEGGLSQTEVNTILTGGESSGNLIPQRLIKYERLTEFGRLRGWRIIRIAIHPEFQGKGYGSKLLNEVVKNAEREGLDWIGSSFSADVKVLNFWIKNGFVPVHMSSRKNEGLGNYSVIVVKPLSSPSDKLVRKAAEMLREKLLRTSHQVYFNVNPLLLAKILHSLPKKEGSVSLPEEYKSMVEAYLSGYLPYNAVAHVVHYLVYNYFTYKSFLDLIEEAVLIGRSLQGKSWYHLSLYLGVKPRVAEEYLRSALRKMLENM